MEIILVVLVVLAMVTVIGHGIWLLLAGFFRALSGRDSGQRKTVSSASSGAKCLQCGRPLRSLEAHCPTCGLARAAPVASELDELDATARQLAAFRAGGSLDQATYDRLSECVRTRRRLLTAARLISSVKANKEPEAVPAQAQALSTGSRPGKSNAPAEVAEALPASPLQEAAAPVPPPPAPAAPRRTPQQRTPVVTETRTPAAPRRSLAEVLGAFMEERNIFWGELVGGLLMVGCSIALVIYLWKDLEKIAYFKFLIFVGTTALVFGAGLYSLYRLKLQTTSRGLFVIAMLLVPLNFLVMAGLSEEERQAEPALRITTELLALGIFASLMAPASRALMPDGRWALLFAVLGISVSPLAVPRFLTPGDVTFWSIALLGGLPVFWYVASAGGLLSRMTRRESLQEAQAKEIFAFLGLAAFPLIVALGFLVYWTGQSARALQELAV
ncbi:MAG TPA: hypothetical protein VGY66_04770, partial [Gemmataceae bacterium]|nr:hypothetical protein [Gemmataceae bacterium]